MAKMTRAARLAQAGVVVPKSGRGRQKAWVNQASDLAQVKAGGALRFTKLQDGQKNGAAFSVTEYTVTDKITVAGARKAMQAFANANKLSLDIIDNTALFSK